MDSADLSSPCQEFSNGGLGIIVTLLVCRQIDFLCFVCVSLIGTPSVCMSNSMLQKHCDTEL